MSQTAWIPTATGGRFYPLAPRVSDVSIYDIAHHLANECRFTGATRWHYSVAQHSVLASYVVPTAWALLHDAAETYLRDLPKPLKESPEFAEYKKIEARVQQTIAGAFSLAWPMPPAVKYADQRVYATELRDLIVCPDVTPPAYAPLQHRIQRWTPETARAVFLLRFRQLWKGRLGPFQQLQNVGLIPRI